LSFDICFLLSFPSFPFPTPPSPPRLTFSSFSSAPPSPTPFFLFQMTRQNQTATFMSWILKLPKHKIFDFMINRWASKLFLKSVNRKYVNSWACSAIPNLFLRCATPQISNPQLFMINPQICKLQSTTLSQKSPKRRLFRTIFYSVICRTLNSVSARRKGMYLQT
jgi:hypothetical protein